MVAARVCAIIVAISSVANVGCGDSSGPTSEITLSAAIDGIVWHPGGPGASPSSATFYQGDSTLSVIGNRAAHARVDQLQLTIAHVGGPGTYQLGDPLLSSYGGYIVSEGVLGDTGITVTGYWSSAALGGSVVVTTLDPAKRTLQGTFQFVARSGSGARVTITEGSFEGHYSTSSENGFPP